MKNRKRDIYSPPAKVMQEELRTRQYVKYQNNAANAYNCGRSAGNNNKSNSNPVLPFYEFPKDCTREYVEIEHDTKSKKIIIHSDNTRLSQINGAMLVAIFTKNIKNHEVQFYHNNNQ